MRDGAKDRCRGQDPPRLAHRPLVSALAFGGMHSRIEKLKCRKQRQRSLPSALQIKWELVKI